MHCVIDAPGLLRARSANRVPCLSQQEDEIVGIRAVVQVELHLGLTEAEFTGFLIDFRVDPFLVGVIVLQRFANRFDGEVKVLRDVFGTSVSDDDVSHQVPDKHVSALDAELPGMLLVRLGF
jgi:hypothetical protein